MSQIHIPKKQRSAPVTAPARGAEHRSGGAMPTSQDLGKRVQLDSAIQDKMERAFGADFSTVELYESPAVEAAGAQAVTMGNRIGFAPGKTDFQSPQGQRLLGHELSHVVGQARGMVEGSGFLQNSGLEHLADRQGAMAAGGQTITAASLQPLSASSIAAASGPMQAKKEPKTEEEKQELELRAQAEAQQMKQKEMQENAAHFIKAGEDLMQSGKDIPMAYTMWDRAEQMQNMVRESRTTQQSLVDEANGIKSQRLARESEDWYAKASQSRDARKNAGGMLKPFKRAGYSILANAQRFMGWTTGLRSKTAVKDGIGDKVKILLPELGNQLESSLDHAMQNSERGKDFAKRGLVGTIGKMLGMDPKGKLSPKAGPIRRFLSAKISPMLARFQDRHEKAVANFISPEGQQAWAQMSDMDKFLYRVKNPLVYLDSKTKGGRGRAMARLKRQQAAENLAEEMRAMDSADFQNTLTGEQQAADMQNLFDEKNSMEQTGLYQTAEQRLAKQNPIDMRRLFDDSYQENDLAYVPEAKENMVASFMINRLDGSSLLKPAKATGNLTHAGLLWYKADSITEKSKSLSNETSRNAGRVLGNFMDDNAEIRARRGMEHATSLIAKAVGKAGVPMAGSAATGINKLVINAADAQKQHRRRVVQESTNYDAQYAFALDQLDPTGKRRAMSDLEGDTLRREAKHAALESIYGKGVQTFQQAESIELENRITNLRRQAQADPELMQLLVSELHIQPDFSDLESKLLYRLSADYQEDETLAEHRQKLANKRQEKKNSLQTTVAKNEAEELSFQDTIKKKGKAIGRSL